MPNAYSPGETDIRPWGDWTVLDTGPGYAVKRIRVTPGGRLSLQRHQHREERWTIVGGEALVTLGERQIRVTTGQSVHIGPREIHRIENPGQETVVFIEVQLGAHLAEDDIERLEDVYGRS
jgi:mannose-1-phosphate guanylyltransferase/mannose-6-phosphate isomerase